MNKFKLLTLFFFLPILTSFSQHTFIVDVTDRSDDLFSVTLLPNELTSENSIYNFAASAPGTYQIMDIGRYVREFKAYNEDDEEISVEKVSTNKWKISDPENLYRINYKIAETWDTPVEENQIFMMAGSSIENDHVLINGQTVFGYFSGMQKYPLIISVEKPESWTIGTALELNEDDYYTAESFDHIVDSPILMGELTKAETEVTGTDIEIYSYSKSGNITSADLMNAMNKILIAAGKFTEGLPVDRYTFLFHFENNTAGAWEHSYSSIYVYQDATLSDSYLKSISATAAHEFFHIITPLNIHSELVANFNFEEPKMSKHIWLYESTTEWASDIMLLRDNVYTVDEYLGEVKNKIETAEHFRNDVSLQTLSLNAPEMQDQFYLFYCKGAVIMTLLDLRILELSNGTRGLREVVNELSKKYGPEKSFSEENFYNEFVDLTFPEIEEFFDDYVRNSKVLPLKEYFEKVGVNYHEHYGYDSTAIDLGLSLTFSEQKLMITSSLSELEEIVKPNDILDKVSGEIVDQSNFREKLRFIRDAKPGDEFNFTVLRDGESIDLSYNFPARSIKHVFEINENADPKQSELREQWIKNL